MSSPVDITVPHHVYTPKEENLEPPVEAPLKKRLKTIFAQIPFSSMRDYLLETLEQHEDRVKSKEGHDAVELLHTQLTEPWTLNPIYISRKVNECIGTLTQSRWPYSGPEPLPQTFSNRPALSNMLLKKLPCFSPAPRVLDALIKLRIPEHCQEPAQKNVYLNEILDKAIAYKARAEDPLLSLFFAATLVQNRVQNRDSGSLSSEKVLDSILLNLTDPYARACFIHFVISHIKTVMNLRHYRCLCRLDDSLRTIPGVSLYQVYLWIGVMLYPGPESFPLTQDVIDVLYKYSILIGDVPHFLKLIQENGARTPQTTPEELVAKVLRLMPKEEWWSGSTFPLETPECE